MNSLKETESLSSEQELDFLQSLLESKELNALVNVHSKVAKVGKDDRLAPLMSSSLQVCYILILSACNHTIFQDDIFLFKLFCAHDFFSLLH